MQSIEGTTNGLLPSPDLAFQWTLRSDCFFPGGPFASIGQMGIGHGGISSNPSTSKGGSASLPGAGSYAKCVSSPEIGVRLLGSLPEAAAVVEESPKEGRAGGFRLKIRVKNPSLRRLISGAIAGTVSRTAVAPLETIRTHLMVGTSGDSSLEVFHNIMKNEGWTGLFRGNFVNVIRVAPSKAIELFAYDTVKKQLTPRPDEPSKLRLPPSLVAGAFAGVSSTLCTYPLELLKTRLTVQRDAYNSLLHAFIKILREEGPSELYRGLTPSLIGVVPYAATNYFAYETLRKAYKKVFKQEEIGNIATLLIGSAAGAFASSATFPLEVARKQMQVGAISGRQVYKNMLHALVSILEQEGSPGLYRGLGPSCMKLVPAAGISFMCYEACKRILMEKEDAA